MIKALCIMAGNNIDHPENKPAGNTPTNLFCLLILKKCL